MLNLDSSLIKKINKYLDYIIHKGISLQPNQVVEIVSSIQNGPIIYLLKEKLFKSRASDVIITYLDGNEIEKEINKDWELFLNKKIDKYKKLVENLFVRITLLSPFTIPITRTKSVDSYNDNIYKLNFVNDYFKANITQHTIATIPNEYWANKLQISISELWNRVIDSTNKYSLLEEYIDVFSDLKIDYLIFGTSLGTYLEVGLVDDYHFMGKCWKTINNIVYEPNIPCYEIFATPNKYRVNGRLVSSKPLFYKNILINNYEIFFENGKIVNEKNLKQLLQLDDNLFYTGEIAIVIPNDNFIYYNTLLDENLGCHIALGNSYESYKNVDYINKSKYHIDLVFGTNDISCQAKLKNGKIVDILNNGRFVYKEIKDEF
ncbi:MAG: aminopeptidase [Anaeroplasma sp.]